MRGGLPCTMHSFQRPRLDELVDFLTGRLVLSRIVALTGPRQTGKTTMIRQALGRVDIPSRYFPVDERLEKHVHQRGEEGGSVRTAWLLDAWEKARRDAEQRARGFVLALDEVQYVKGWSTIVKTQWDRDRRTGCPVARDRVRIRSLDDADRRPRDYRGPFHAGARPPLVLLRDVGPRSGSASTSTCSSAATPARHPWPATWKSGEGLFSIRSSRPPSSGTSSP